LLEFHFLQPLELLDEVNLEFRADPHVEFKSDVLVGVSAAIAPRFGNKTDGIGLGRVKNTRESINVA
jgi:hypothetical protein